MKINLTQLNFGEPEAEADTYYIERAFFETEAWNHVKGKLRLPFVVGRKGVGKSAIAERLKLDLKNLEIPVIPLVPSQFRHVEIRGLLSRLISKNTSWQYIYGKIWQGIILGQIINCARAPANKKYFYKDSPSGSTVFNDFIEKCPFYTNDLDESLSEVISHFVEQHLNADDELTLVQLRKEIEPYNPDIIIAEINKYFGREDSCEMVCFIIDGLDDYWDRSEPSIYFLAQLLTSAKTLSNKMRVSIRFTICLRDSIFRTLVDTKAIEYDKIESSIIYIDWRPTALFELIVKRVAVSLGVNTKDAEQTLRSILPAEVDGIGLEIYIGRYVLNRPRDYINFFRMLQAKVGSGASASALDIKDLVSKYKVNRLIDLESEFGETYPRLNKVVGSLDSLPSLFSKDQLFKKINDIIDDIEFRKQAPVLLQFYGEASALARAMISIGVLGIFDHRNKTILFINEFNENRVKEIFSSNNMYAIHPSYRQTDIYAMDEARVDAGIIQEDVIIVEKPPEYLPLEDIPCIALKIAERQKSRAKDLLKDLQSISEGNDHSKKFEVWTTQSLVLTMPTCLLNPKEQTRTTEAGKIFEIIFDINSKESPFSEFVERYKTHRLLVECKNTVQVRDADVSKLKRDMDALHLNVALLVFRSDKPEPSGEILKLLRGIYQNSSKKQVIIGVSHSFIESLLNKPKEENALRKLNVLWRDHLEKWLPV